MVYGKLLNIQPDTLCNMYHVTRWEGSQLPRLRATVLCRKGLRPGAALLNLWDRRLCSGSKGNMRLDMEKTSNSLALGSEMTTGNHPIGRATDICPGRGSAAGLSKPALYTVSVLRVFSLPRGNQRSFLDSSPGLPGLYLASLHQLPRGWTYPMLVGNRHGCIRWGNGMQYTLSWFNYPTLQYRLASSTRWTLSWVSRSFTGLQWNGTSFFQFHHWVIWTMEA